MQLTLPVLCLAAGVALLAGFGVRRRMATDPLILPSLLANRGFTAGLLLGPVYVISLFFQTALGSRRPRPRAPEPAHGRHQVSSIVCCTLLAKLGRALVIIGLGITLTGAASVCTRAVSPGSSAGQSAAQCSLS